MRPLDSALDRTNPNRPKIGLLAGWGRYPFVLAQALRGQGYELFGLGVAGHADPALADHCDHYDTVGMARLGAAIRYFRRHGVRRVTMAGKIHKVKFFEPGVWFRNLPDWRTVRRFFPHFVLARHDRKDDTLLKAVIDEFALDGIHFEPATDFAPELLVKPGQLTTRKPTGAQWRDIEFGWTLAKEMGRLDVGQSVAIRGRAAIAVEAIEGTDECIRRAGALCRGGEFTLVKVAKPGQDMRFDVPTIGMGTLESLVAAGGRVLAVEAARTILIDEPAVIEYANRHGVAIVALEKTA